MPRKKTTKVVDAPVLDYRYDAKRKNIRVVPESVGD